MRLFRENMSSEEIEDCKKWARDNYKAHDKIKGVWHPEVQKECVQINIETPLFKVAANTVTDPIDVIHPSDWEE
jgi:hypothetical protein